MRGKIISINLSKEKGKAKIPVKPNDEVFLKEHFGIVGDVHSGSEREVSFLGIERINEWLNHKVAKKKIKKINPGDFAENITTEGIDWLKVNIGDKIEISKSNSCKPAAILQVLQIGKPCHSSCNIKKLVGDCLMPKEGIFAKVLSGGKIKVGDIISVIHPSLVLQSVWDK